MLGRARDLDAAKVELGAKGLELFVLELMLDGEGLE